MEEEAFVRIVAEVPGELESRLREECHRRSKEQDRFVSKTELVRLALRRFLANQ